MGEETKDIITTNLGPRVISVLVQLGSGMNLVNEVMERRFYGSRYCLWPRWVHRCQMRNKNVVVCYIYIYIMFGRVRLSVCRVW